MSKLLMCLNTSDSKVLCPLLHQNGFEVTSTSDELFALKLIDEGHFDLILIEPTCSHFDRFISAIKKNPRLLALLISYSESCPMCPFEKGFLGFFSLKKVSSLVSFLKNFFKKMEHEHFLSSQRVNTQEVIAKSQVMLDLFEKVQKIAKTQSSVLITGESGTGKEVIAKLIHDQSLRSKEPFVAINSCAISPQLLESELFGYEKGAFTGANMRKIGRLEYANFGTFFFDEIGETPLDLQAKLLRVIQERTFERVGGLEPIKLNIRFIAATNKNLEDAIAEKTFREDLFYRLNVIPLHIPPLRERKDDIIALATHFIKKYAQRNGSQILKLSSEAAMWLESYNWPGNVRELSNVIERACVLASDNLITASDLSIKTKPRDTCSFIDDLNLKNLEKKAILKALAETGGNKTKAAKLLGVSIKTLRAKT